MELSGHIKSMEVGKRDIDGSNPDINRAISDYMRPSTHRCTSPQHRKNFPDEDVAPLMGDCKLALVEIQVYLRDGRD